MQAVVHHHMQGIVICVKQLFECIGRSGKVRPHRMDETCQGSVPEAIIAFLEGESFEDVIRTAVSLGGDSDTIACIAGSIAEAFYGVPEELKAECRKRLTPDLLEILERFETLTRA